MPSRRSLPARGAQFDRVYQQTYPRVYRIVALITADRSQVDGLIEAAYKQAFMRWTWKPQSVSGECWVWSAVYQSLNVSTRRHFEQAVMHPRQAINARLGGKRAAEETPLRHSLLRLPADVRLVLALHWAAGFSAQDVAAILGHRNWITRRHIARASKLFHRQNRGDDAVRNFFKQTSSAMRAMKVPRRYPKHAAYREPPAKPRFLLVRSGWSMATAVLGVALAVSSASATSSANPINWAAHVGGALAKTATSFTKEVVKVVTVTVTATPAPTQVAVLPPTGPPPAAPPPPPPPSSAPPTPGATSTPTPTPTTTPTPTPTPTPTAFITPTVSTQAAGNVTYNSATLNASVNVYGCNAQPAQPVFAYGLTTSYGSSSTASIDLTSNVNQFTSANVSGLNFRTTYHFRISETSGCGNAVGSDLQFTTGPPPPFFTDNFESDTVGAAPANWIRDSKSSWLVANNGPNRFVHNSSTVSSNYRYMTGGSGPNSDYMVTGITRANDVSTTSMGVIGRASSDGKNFYACALQGGNTLALVRMAAGVPSVVRTAPITYSLTAWQTLRLWNYGSSISCQMWGTNPTGGSINASTSSYSDSAPLAAGFAGFTASSTDTTGTKGPDVDDVTAQQ